MRLSELAGRRVALLGLGEDVRAAIPAIRAVAPESVCVVDDRRDAALGGVDRASLVEAARTADVVVRSPGFPRYTPELAAARRRGQLSTTPLDLWWGDLDVSRRVVAVTGTKGKSTTASMVVALARARGVDAALIGNIGTPAFLDGWDRGQELVVVEVSSYQAADLHHIPDVAILTALSQDHVDWHGSVERYVSDKLRVVRNESGTVPQVLVPSVEAGARAALDALGAIQPTIVDVRASEDPSVPDHTLANASLAAAAVSRLTGLPASPLEALEVAPPLQSRLTVISHSGHLTWVDDALASNPTAAAAALRWVRRQGRSAVVLLGGADRSVDVGPLEAEVSEWDLGALTAVALPSNGEVIASAVGLHPGAVVENVAEAVSWAAANAPSGAVVLLSPAAPTPSHQGTWRDRGGAFRAAVEALR